MKFGGGRGKHRLNSRDIHWLRLSHSRSSSDAKIVGTPDECVARISDLEDFGINYIRFAFDDPSQMEAVARLILPAYDDRANTVSARRAVAAR